MHVCKAKNVRVFYVLFLSSVCTRVLVSLSPCACECALSLLHMYAHAHTQMQRARTAHALTHGERLRNERTPGEGVRPLCLVSFDPGGRPRPDMMQLQWSLPRWVQVQCRYLRSCTQNVAACTCTNSIILQLTEHTHMCLQLSTSLSTRSMQQGTILADASAQIHRDRSQPGVIEMEL